MSANGGHVGRIGLWTSGSQAAQITDDNPMGVRKSLFISPLATAREEWIPTLDAAALALGYRPRFKVWMPYGQKLINKVMCADSWVSLLKSGTGRPHEYAPAFVETRKHCEELIVYHGCPRYLAETPTGAKDSYAWLMPALVAGCSICLDAEGDKSSREMKALAAKLDAQGARYYVEPLIKGGTPWEAAGIGCFVVLSKLRETIRKAWSPATGAAKEYQYINILVGSVADIDVPELRGYLAKGWHVFVPPETPADTLKALAAPEVAATS